MTDPQDFVATTMQYSATVATAKPAVTGESPVALREVKVLIPWSEQSRVASSSGTHVQVISPEANVKQYVLGVKIDVPAAKQEEAVKALQDAFTTGENPMFARASARDETRSAINFDMKNGRPPMIRPETSTIQLTFAGASDGVVKLGNNGEGMNAIVAKALDKLAQKKVIAVESGEAFLAQVPKGVMRMEAGMELGGG